MNKKEELKIKDGYTNYILYSNGRVWNTKTETWLGEKVKRNGYVIVTLRDDQGYKRTHYLHRLLYEAFIGEIPSDKQINHKDENKMNNDISNLELVTPRENCMYGTRNKRISESCKGKKKLKNTFKVVVQNPDTTQLEYTYNSISELCKNHPSQNRMTWQMRLYKSKNPLVTYVMFEGDKVLFITPTNEEYKRRIEEMNSSEEEQGKETK